MRKYLLYCLICSAVASILVGGATSGQTMSIRPSRDCSIFGPITLHRYNCGKMAGGNCTCSAGACAPDLITK